jgi:putative ABC transport system substrate-binding protein
VAAGGKGAAAAHADGRLLQCQLGARDGTLVDIFRRTLTEAGYVGGRNVVVDYRWGDGNLDRFPALSDWVRRPGDVLFVSGGNPPVLAAKAATSTIPIVFVTGGDPVATGLVASLNRPGRNVTGATVMGVAHKQVDLLRKLVPTATAAPQ